MNVLVIIPTYQERETLGEAVERTRSAVPGAHLLVVDDASPDGTGDLADDLAAQDAHVHVLHRAGKDGLGRAYVAGFRWALERDYDVVVEMDADGSHQPKHLPALLAALEETGADLVLGSRWVPGGEVVNWPASRLMLSRGGNAYTRLALGLPVLDATGGYRVYRAAALARLPLEQIHSHGYCFQVDMTRRIHAGGGLIVERPITFVERRLGESKMSRAIVLEALWRVTAWGVAYRLSRLLGRARPRSQQAADEAGHG